MLLVIETDDFTNLETAKRFLASMQRESDDAAAEMPEEYGDGYGTLSLGTPHSQTNARIVGILHPRNSPSPEARYAIEPITTGVSP